MKIIQQGEYTPITPDNWSTNKECKTCNSIISISAYDFNYKKGTNGYEFFLNVKCPICPSDLCDLKFIIGGYNQGIPDEILNWIIINGEQYISYNRWYRRLFRYLFKKSKPQPKLLETSTYRSLPEYHG